MAVSSHFESAATRGNSIAASPLGSNMPTRPAKQVVEAKERKEGAETGGTDWDIAGQDIPALFLSSDTHNNQKGGVCLRRYSGGPRV